MITFYFDTNKRSLIQSPGNQAPATPQTWVYGDNYNLQVYICALGSYLPILTSDTISAILWQSTTPPTVPPQQQLAIIGTPTVLTDVNGNSYFLFNVGLKTSQLATLVQETFVSAQLLFHLEFNPTDTERFSESQDLAITMNPDPLESPTGGTPVPPGYPANPNVFQIVAQKGIPNGYAALDANGNLNPNEIPTDNTLHVVAGNLSVVAGGGTGGNPWVGSIVAAFVIPAIGANAPLQNLTAPIADLVNGQAVLITDGTRFMNATVAGFSASNILLTNTGPSTFVGQTFNAGAHIYLGNSAPPASTVEAGIVGPLSGTTTQFLNGAGAFAVPAFGSLSGVPATFPPATHGTQHLPTGTDPVPLATVSTAGLCPPPDGSTVVISGGHLTAPGGGGGGGTAYLAVISASFILPAVGVSINLNLVAANPDINGPITIIDGLANVAKMLVTAGMQTTTLTCVNWGGSSPPGTTFQANAHIYLGGAEIATSSSPGIVMPDGTTVVVSGTSGQIHVPTATAAALGVVKPDGVTILDTAGAISVPTATGSALGLVRPDGTSLTIAAGVLSATGGAPATSTTLGTTRPDNATITVGTGANAGVLTVPLATTAAAGIVKPDGVTILDTAGAISVPAATASAEGLVKPDGTIITVGAGGAITVPPATAAALGVVRPDGTTCTVAAGVLSAAGAPVATGTVLGICRPDNTSITVASGVLSAVGGAGGGQGYATTTTSFTCPIFNQSVTGLVLSNSGWMQVNKLYWIVGVGTFICTANNTATNTVSLQNSGARGNASSGTVGAGALVLPGAIWDGNVWYRQEEFIYSISGSNNQALGTDWVTISSTSGQIAQPSASLVNNSVAGVLLGATTSAAYTGLETNLNTGYWALLGGNTFMLRWRVEIQTALSTATNEFEVFAGFGNGGIISSLSRYAGFKYNGVLGSGPGNWMCSYLKQAGTVSDNDSGVVVALSTWYDLYLIVDSVNTYWLIGVNDGTPVQHFTTPTTNVILGTAASDTYIPMIAHAGVAGSPTGKTLVDLNEFAIIWQAGPNPRYTLRGFAISGS